MNNPSVDPAALPDSVYEHLSVCVQSGVHLQVMSWRPKKPVCNDPIVFVPGWVSSVSGWMPLIGALASRRPVYYIETREKKSAILKKKKLCAEDFQMSRIAEDIISVCRQLNIDTPRTTVAGCSLGATALLEALKGNRLVAGTAFLIAPNSEFKAPWYLEWILFLPAFLYHGIKFFLLWYLKNFMVDVRKEPEQMKRYQDTLLAAHPERIKLSGRALICGRYEVWPNLESVTLPVALAYAATDKLHSSQNIQRMANRLPRVSVISCPSNQYMHSAKLLKDIEAFVNAAQS